LHDGTAETLFDQAEFDGTETAGEGCEISENAALIRRMLDGLTPVPQPILDQVSALVSLAQRD